MVVRIPSFIKTYIFEFANIKVHRGQFVSKLDLRQYDAIKTLVAMQANLMMRTCECDDFRLVAAIRKMTHITILSCVVVYKKEGKSVVTRKYGSRGNVHRAIVT